LTPGYRTFCKGVGDRASGLQADT